MFFSLALWCSATSFCTFFRWPCIIKCPNVEWFGFSVKGMMCILILIFNTLYSMSKIHFVIRYWVDIYFFIFIFFSKFKGQISFTISLCWSIFTFSSLHYCIRLTGVGAWNDSTCPPLGIWATKWGKNTYMFIFCYQRASQLTVMSIFFWKHQSLY